MDRNSQRTLLEKDYVGQTSIFLPEEIAALELVAEQLCHTLPDINNPFSFGLGTRTLTSGDLEPQLELVLNHVQLAGAPYDRPDFYQTECRKMLQMAARPMQYFAKLTNLNDFCNPYENALKNGVVVHNDGMGFASVKDENGWFVMGLRFSYAPSHESVTFAVTFLTGIAETICAMDEQNEHLRSASKAFRTSCRNWQVELPHGQPLGWLNESNFMVFARSRYERNGPRKFFG